jgi:uncharacterized phage protein (TIGR01671 family)
MREIKFRAWDRERRKMISPRDLIHLDGETTKGLLEMSPYLELMQYTGLKDKNGNEIYEGDIVKCHDHPTGIEDGAGEVIFNWGYYSVKGLLPPLHDFGTAWTEVIGNIHEHRHLL